MIDGLHALYWKDVRELLSVKVFVEADHATCLARRIQRDTTRRGRSEASVRAQYELTVRPMYERFVRPTQRHADLLLRGEDPLERNVGRIVGLLGSRPG